VETVDAVDLSPAVLGGAPYFGRENGGFLENPKARPRIEDGRHHLLLSQQSYDVITLEPPPPRFSGIANLYSRDFYELCLSRQAAGGVVAQWIPMHSHTEEEMRMLVRSFVEVFPASTLWVPVQRDAIIVGSLEGITVDLQAIAERMAYPAVGADLRDVDVGSAEALVSTWLVDAPSLVRYVEGVAPITDDRPSIEFFAGRPLVEAPVHLERLMPFRMDAATLKGSLRGLTPAHDRELDRQLRAMDHFYRGSVLASQGNSAGRIQEFTRALQLAPDSRFFQRLNGHLPP
jgi:spermidine synthase